MVYSPVAERLVVVRLHVIRVSGICGILIRGTYKTTVRISGRDLMILRDERLPFGAGGCAVEHEPPFILAAHWKLALNVDGDVALHGGECEILCRPRPVLKRALEIVVVARLVQQVESPQFLRAVVGQPTEGILVLLVVAMKIAVVHHRTMMRVDHRVVKSFSAPDLEFFNALRRFLPLSVTQVFVPCVIFEFDTVPVSKVPLGVGTSPGD